jgi:UDP-3-O-[3-hydroxymyristoyl] N-acetylglucosamine deacetylase
VSAPNARSGIGLHGGKPAVALLVAEPGPVRIERGGVICALAELRVLGTRFSTTVGCDAFSVGTVEHLFAALAGLGVRDGVRIVVQGDELPLLDGGARAFAEDVAALGIAARPAPLRVTREARIEVDGSEYFFAPGDGTRVAVEVELPSCCASDASWAGDADDFVRRIAPARTFALERDLAELERRGLARHASRESVLVVGDAIHGAGEVAPDEPARHKLLDFIGDAYFHGGPPRGNVRAVRPGHARNHGAFVRALELGVLALAALLLIFFPARARADDESARPSIGFDLTHPWPELAESSMLASVTYNDSAIQGTTYVRVERLSFEAPIASSRWYVGAAYDAAIGQDENGSARFVSGNPEIWGRGVWTSSYGLSFGGGFSFVIPTGSYALSDPAATTAYAAIAARGWDRALFDPDNATLRPSLDVRLVTGPITVQYRQALEIATDFGDLNFRFAAVGTFYFAVRISKLFSAGVDLIEYYRLDSGLDDDARPYFAVGAHVTLSTRWFQPSLGVMTNIGSPLNAISRIGAPISIAPTSFIGVHFDLDFPFHGVTLGGKKR